MAWLLLSFTHQGAAPTCLHHHQLKCLCGVAPESLYLCTTTTAEHDMRLVVLADSKPGTIIAAACAVEYKPAVGNSLPG